MNTARSMVNSALIAIAVGLIPSWALADSPSSEAHRALTALETNASADNLAAALQAMDDWLQRDFPEARPKAVDLLTDPALPTEFRAELFIKASAAASSASKDGLDDDIRPAYRTLVDELPSGSRRSSLHKAFGNIKLWLGQFEAAESLFKRAESEIAASDVGKRASIKNSIGVTLAQQGKLDEALDTMLEAYRLYEQTEAAPSPLLLRNIGGLSIYLENWEQSERFSRLAIDRLARDDPNVVGVYSNLAGALTEQGKLDEALVALQTGMTIGEEQGRPNASVISNLGYVLRELGQPREGLAQFERAAELNRAASDLGSLAISLKNIGETLIELDQRESAQAALQQSLEAYREADIKPRRLELYPVLVENLEVLGRYPEALAMMREYRALTEELASADAQARVAELQTAFDLERRERELAESERERLAGEARLATLEAERSRERLLGVGLVGGVVALGLFLLLMFRTLRLRTRANQLLAEKNAEIDRQHRALAETNTRLQRQSVEDELTGLGNRRSIRRLFESELPKALTDNPSILVLIDLDRFKGINDTFGHPMGDKILARFAEVLREVADENDVLARWGGEEFLWLIAGTGIADAADRCRALTDRLRRTEFTVGDRTLSITCSMGVATVDVDVEDPQASFDQAVKIADAALYEAKRAGRDQWIGFERRAEDRRLFEGPLDVDSLIKRGALVRRHA